MIIGITGKAGSGKDTIADILVRDHGFAKIALADPMKRFLYDVLKFSHDQLWGPSSSRNAADRRYPRPEVVDLEREGHRSDAQTGDDTCLCTKCGSRSPAFDSKAFDKWAAERCGQDHLSPRVALQTLGTEWGRAMYEDIWVHYAITLAQALLPHVYPETAREDWVPFYTPSHGLMYGARGMNFAKGVVISDVRFPNEVAAIRRTVGGRVWRTSHGRGLEGAAGQHASEAYFDALEVDAAVPDSTLEALPAIVTSLLHGAV